MQRPGGIQDICSGQRQELKPERRAGPCLPEALNARLRGSDFIPEVLGRPRRGTKRALQLQKSCSEVSWVGLEQRGRGRRLSPGTYAPSSRLPARLPLWGCGGSQSSAGPEKLLIASRRLRPWSICCLSWSVLKL